MREIKKLWNEIQIIFISFMALKILDRLIISHTPATSNE